MVTALALGVVIFVLSVAYNFVAARGTQACARSERLRAANSDLVTGAIGFVALYAWVHVGWWTILPELAGGWLGTFFGTARDSGHLAAPLTPVRDRSR